MKCPATYPLKIQAIRSKHQQPRFYVYFPLPLAAAIGLQAGDQVQWELLDRGELTLSGSIRPNPWPNNNAISRKGVFQRNQ